MAEAGEDSKTHLPYVTGQLDRSFSINTSEFIQRVLDKCTVSIVEDPAKSASKAILDVFTSEEAFGDGTYVRVKNLRDILENKDTSTCLREMREMIIANPNSYVKFKYALARTGQVLLLKKIETTETNCHDELKQTGKNLYGCVCTDDSRCSLQEPLKCPKESRNIIDLPTYPIKEATNKKATEQDGQHDSKEISCIKHTIKEEEYKHSEKRSEREGQKRSEENSNTKNSIEQEGQEGSEESSSNKRIELNKKQNESEDRSSSNKSSLEQEGQRVSEEIPNNKRTELNMKQNDSEERSSNKSSLEQEGQHDSEERSTTENSIEQEGHIVSEKILSSNNSAEEEQKGSEEKSGNKTSTEQEGQTDAEARSSIKNLIEKEGHSDTEQRSIIINSIEQEGQNGFEERASLTDSNDQDDENGSEKISILQNEIMEEVTPFSDEISSEVPQADNSQDRSLVLTCKDEQDMHEESMDEPHSNHILVVDAIRETKEFMALLNEWIPKRESTIREIESIASELSELRTLKQRDSPSKVLELRTVKKTGKVSKMLALGGGAAAVAGAFLGRGPLLLTGTAGAVASGSNNSGSDIVDKHLPEGQLEGQLESAQNVRNEDEALFEKMNSVKLNLDSKIRDLSLDENLSSEQVQCCLLMATFIEGELAHENPFQLGKMLMTSKPFAKMLSNSFGVESEIGPSMVSTVAEESMKGEDLIAFRMLGVTQVGSIYSLFKDAMDFAKGSPSEAAKGLEKFAREIMKQVKDIRDFLQELRNQAACFERIMRDQFHKRLEKVSTQGLASDDDTQIITFMLKYSSNAWQQAFQSLNVNLNEFAFNLARVFSNMKYILEEERNKRQGNHLNITVIAHGRIDPQTLVPCHVYYFNNCLVSVTLYSPWGCAIDTSVIYGIATDTMMPQNVQYSADVSPERPATWNYLLREAELAPNIKCTPLLEDTDARHSLLEFVDILRFNSDDVIIPYFTGIGNDLLPYPEVPLWVFATAVGMCAQSLNLTINLKLAACLSPEKPDTAGTELSQFCQVPMDLNPPVLMTSQLDTDQEAAEKVDRLL